MPNRFVRTVKPWLTAQNVGQFLVYVSAFVTAVLILWMVRVTSDQQHTNQVQTWTFRLTVAENCLENWESYEGARTTYTDIPQAITDLVRQFGGANIPLDQIESTLNDAFAARFEAYPQPSCDRERAREQRDEAERELSDLGVSV